ncbi:MAG: LamG domain-containing protein [Deltaproteobacteria bacterium]|nr:LamG domain-containing protein [Deltaproteobacteria bacterium]
MAIPSPSKTPFLIYLAMLICFPSSPLRADIPTDGLIASFPFNGNADDESGNGNHGMVLGPSLTTDRFGEVDKAYRFDGFDDYILANADNLPTGERTLSLWFRSDRLNNRPGLIGYGGGTCGTSWVMGINNGSADRQYQMQGHCLANRIRAGYGPEPVEQWHHWLMTTDATGTRMLIDGVEYVHTNNFVTNTNVTGTDLALGVAVSPAGVAPFTDVNTGYFEGRLDDVAIYDRSLESSEIQEVLAGNLPLDYVLFYPFDGSAADQSGNANDGFVVGASLTDDRFGNPQQAYAFDGMDDYIRASGDSLPTGERTISLWFQATQLTNRPVLLGYGGGGCGTSWLMGINNGGSNNQFQMQGHCLANLTRAGYAPEPVLTWHHWVIQTDPSGTRIYVDGILHGSNDIFVSNTNVSGRDLSLGVIPSSSGIAPYTDVNTGFFDGKLDDIYIYNRAIDSDEIQELLTDGDPSVIFRNGFESGDTSRWTGVTP